MPSTVAEAILTLPSLYAISACDQYGEARFLELLDDALKNGLELLQLREHALGEKAYFSLARKVIDHCHAYSAKVLLNSPPEWVNKLGADGVHLTQDCLMAINNRPLENELIVAASCHDPQSLKKAEEVSADFVVLSPVKKTSSHPDTKPIGWDRFQELCATTALPIYALGGMCMEDLTEARQHGAQGVAMIRGIWQR